MIGILKVVKEEEEVATLYKFCVPLIATKQHHGQPDGAHVVHIVATQIQKGIGRARHRVSQQMVHAASKGMCCIECGRRRCV